MSDAVPTSRVFRASGTIGHLFHNYPLSIENNCLLVAHHLSNIVSSLFPTGCSLDTLRMYTGRGRSKKEDRRTDSTHCMHVDRLCLSVVRQGHPNPGAGSHYNLQYSSKSSPFAQPYPLLMPIRPLQRPQPLVMMITCQARLGDCRHL